MPRTLLVLLIALLAFAVACGDDDDGTATPVNTGASGSATATDDGGETATTDDGGKTPDPDDTPAATTPVATAPGEVPTPGPTAPGGTPAVAPDDESAFLAQFEGQSFDQHDCAYNPATALTNCGQYGVYSIDPPIVGQDTQCAVLFFSNAPRVIQCHAIDSTGTPLTRNYEIIQQ